MLILWNAGAFVGVVLILGKPRLNGKKTFNWTGFTPVPSAGATPVKQKKIPVSLGRRGRRDIQDFYFCS